MHHVTRLAAGTLAILVGSAVLVAAPSGSITDGRAPPRERTLLADRPGRVEAALERSEVTLPESLAVPLEAASDVDADAPPDAAVLAVAARVSCTVVDDRGIALAGAVVLRADEVLATSDGHGVFSFDAALEQESGARLLVRAPGHASRCAAPAGWHEIEDEDPLLVVLPRLAGLTGVVVGPDGAPVEGTRVVASPLSLEDSYDWSETDEPESGDAEATTDAAGRFRFEGLDVGEWTVDATLEGCVGRHADVVLAPDETTACPTLALGATVPLDGLVLDAWGSRVAGATVRFQHLDESEGDESEAEDEPATEPIIGRIVDVVTESSGRFEIESVAPGRWWIGVLPPRDCPCGPILAVLDVPADGSAAPVLRLVEATRHLAGFVVDQGGGPVAGLELEFRPDSLLNGGPSWTAVTDRFGRFDLDVPPGLDLHVRGKRADAPLWVWGDVRADGDAEFRLQLSEGGQA